MSARLCLAALLGLAPALSGCSRKAEDRAAAKAAAAQEPAAVARKPAPLFYYDLGPAAVNVSAYPEKQRKNYKLFLSVCGTCHTTARPLNAPYIDADTWRRYVRRMHVKMENRAILLSQEDHERILEFLIYDSKVRKISRSGEFQTTQEKLKKLFEQEPP